MEDLSDVICGHPPILHFPALGVGSFSSTLMYAPRLSREKEAEVIRQAESQVAELKSRRTALVGSSTFMPELGGDTLAEAFHNSEPSRRSVPDANELDTMSSKVVMKILATYVRLHLSEVVRCGGGKEDVDYNMDFVDVRL